MPNRTSGIRDVTFDNVSVLSSDKQQEIVDKLQRESPAWLGQQTPEMVARFIGNVVLEAYQDEGYWRAKISSQVTWVRGQGADRQVDAQVTAISEGQPYWVRDIRWRGTSVFPNDALLRALAIRPSDVMKRTALDAGMDAVRRLYVAEGYLASTLTPEMEFDDATHALSLTLAVDEDKLFYFRNLSVAGLSPSMTRQLESDWEQMRRQPYSAEKLRSFFERRLPMQQPRVDPMEHSTSDINLDTHTVDVQLSFSPVTQAEKTPQ